MDDGASQEIHHQQEGAYVVSGLNVIVGTVRTV